MTIANRLKQHLDRNGVPFETVSHPRTATASHTAQAAHVPGDRLAKTVVIHQEDGCVLAVVPSTHRVELDTLRDVLDRRLGRASESEVEALFEDCDPGAAPPVGDAYGVPVVLDPSLAEQPEVYFEGGDHRTLVRVTGTDFDRLMQSSRHEVISHHI